MAIERGTEPSEAQIAVHWKEEETIRPPAKFIGQANVSDPAIVKRFSEKNFPECFREYADMLHWDQYWHTTLDTSNAPFWKWFVGGKTERVLQLRRPALGPVQEQSGVHFCPGTRR